MVKWQACWSSAPRRTLHKKAFVRPWQRDAVLAWYVLWQQEQQSCVGRGAGWKPQEHLVVCRGWAWGCPQTRPAGAGSENGSLWTCVAQGPPMPKHALLLLCHPALCPAAGFLQGRNDRMCHILCCFRNHPPYTQPAQGLSCQFAWGSSSSEQILFSYKVLTPPSSVPGTEIGSLRSVVLKSLSSQETRRCTSMSPFLRAKCATMGHFFGSITQGVLQSHTTQSCTCWNSFEQTFQMPEQHISGFSTALAVLVGTSRDLKDLSDLLQARDL